MTTGAMRAQFEAIARKRCMSVLRSLDDYAENETADAWLGFQLGFQATLRSPAVAGLVEALRAADGLAACCMSVDGYSREELDNMARATAPVFRAALAQYATLTKGEGE